MKKRLLGLLTAAAMLLSAMPVFAGGEIPSGDDLIWFNDGTSVADFNAPKEGTRESDGNAIKMTATYNGTGALNYQIQKTGLKFSKSSDTSAILSFKIKAGQTDKHFNIALRHEWKETAVVEGKEEEVTKGSEITLFAMSASGKLAYSGDGEWIGAKDSFAGNDAYTPDTWYDVSMVLNKSNRKIDYYINGAKYGTATVADDKFAFDSQNIIFKSTVTVGSDLAPTLGTANFWLDDIMWLSGSDNSFYAFADSDEYSVNNPTVNIKLTEQVKADTVQNGVINGVKVYKVNDKTEVGATASLTSARNIEVKVNGTLSPEEEYRIEIPELTSVTGKTINHQNVYFMSGESIIFSDDFSGYDKSVKNGNSAGEFYKPANWYTNTNWATQYTTLQPLSTTQSDGIKGNVVEFKKQNSSAEAGDWGWAAIYREFGEKINSGVLTVEYDVKAVKAQNKSEASWVQSQLLLGVYKDALNEEQYTYPDSTDSAVLAKNIIGREAISGGTVPSNNDTNNLQFVGGVQGGAICRFMDNTSLTDGYYHLNGGTDAVWDIDNEQKWYKVKVTFDYNKKTVSTNVVGVKDFGSYPMSNFKIEDGISAISFGSSAAGDAFTKDIYLDNVTVKHDTSTTKVSKVRFIDGNGTESGISDSVSTLSEKVQITFVNGAIDSDCATGGITLTDSENNSIGLINGEFNSDRTVYTAELVDLMKANTNYTLSVSGLTSGGLDIPVKTYSLKTEENGYFDVSKPYINGTIAAGNTITIGVKVLNTTGENKNVTFSYATYSGNQMIGCELEEKGVGGENKAVYTKEYTLTLDAETAAKLTDIRAFVWGDLTSVVPLTDFASLAK